MVAKTCRRTVWELERKKRSFKSVQEAGLPDDVSFILSAEVGTECCPEDVGERTEREQTSSKRGLPLEDELTAAEAHILSRAGIAGASVQSKQITLPGPDDISINYVVVGDECHDAGTKPACVLVHGYGCGVGSWAANYACLASRFVVFGIDMVGFGRSSRPAFNSSEIPAHRRVQDAEDYFVLPIERWRAAMTSKGYRQLESAIWIGHSFGGYVLSCYALKFPARIQKLILADAWGVQAATEVDEQRIPAFLRAIVSSLPTPLCPIRCLGRVWSQLGRSVLNRVRREQYCRWNSSLNAMYLSKFQCATAIPAIENAQQRNVSDNDQRKASYTSTVRPHEIRSPSSASHWLWLFNVVKSAVMPQSSGQYCDEYCLEDPAVRLRRAGRGDGSESCDTDSCLTASSVNVADYFYYLTAQQSLGGEHAFKALCKNGFFHFAERPQEAALCVAFAPGGVLAHAQLHLIYGRDSWIDAETWYRLAKFIGPNCTVASLQDAGHHLQLDVPHVFNQYILGL